MNVRRSVFISMRQADNPRIHREANRHQGIGLKATYTGDEHLYLAVLEGAARPDFDSDRPGMQITDDATLALHGGLRADDRVDVLPRIAHDRDWSFCSSDVRVADFEGCAPAGRLAHRHG